MICRKIPQKTTWREMVKSVKTIYRYCLDRSIKRNEKYRDKKQQKNIGRKERLRRWIKEK